MDTLAHDIRYALRRLARSPGFTLVAVLTLALGIGANSAIFSVVNGVLLQPLPYPQPEQLITVNHVPQDGSYAVMSPANFRDVREQNTVLQRMSFFERNGFTLTGRGEPVRLEGASVGDGFLEVLQVRPALGRGFRPEENEPGRGQVAILSHGTWAQRFGADPKVIGSSITLNGEAYEVIGVMPAGFSFPSERDVYVPREYDQYFLSPNSRGAWFLSVVARMKPGVTVEQAAAQIGEIGKRLEAEYPEVNTDLALSGRSLHEAMVGDLRTSLLVLLGAVGLVLLIACANVANLLLARATARETELAVRTALGAGRGRLVRQLLTESVLLGVVGGLAGLLLAVWGSAALVAMRPEGIPRLDSVRIDAAVVAFTGGVALLTGLVFGLIPAVQITRGSLASSIREGGRGQLSGRGSRRLRSSLVVAEVALAMVLLTGAGLLIQSFLRLQNVYPGFQPEGALTLAVDLPAAEYDTDAERTLFYEQLTERLNALPGVRSTGAVSALPLRGYGFFISFEVEGREPPAPGEEPAMSIRVATPDYFQTMGIPVVRGRAFRGEDRMDAPQVVVINEAAVRHFFPGEEPMGKRITLGWGRGEDQPNVGGVVVGIVGDVRDSELASEAEPMLWVPHAQAPGGAMDVVMRTTVPPLSLAPAARRAVHELDPELAINRLQPLEQFVSESVSQPRFYTVLLSIFAGVALLLAGIGIFGVISYAVAQRTREIGVRMALGAHPRDVLRMVVGGAFGLAALGVALGLAGALAGTRLLSGLLFGVAATDPLTFAGVAVVLLGVAGLASYLPARAAVRVDPNAALRYE